MVRHLHRGIIFATLLLWQAGIAFAMVPRDSTVGSAASCHAHVPNSTESVAQSGQSGGDNKPACCSTVLCKCGVAPGAVTLTIATPRSVIASSPASSDLTAAPPITARASDPFRPPI